MATDPDAPHPPAPLGHQPPALRDLAERARALVEPDGDAAQELVQLALELRRRPGQEPDGAARRGRRPSPRRPR